VVENVRNQGRVDEVRIMECLPFEIKGLLDAFVEHDTRIQELEAAKEKRNAEVR